MTAKRRSAKPKRKQPGRAARKIAPKDTAPAEIASKHDLFIAEYLIDLNGTRAYKKVYGVKSDKVAGVNAARLLGNASVRAKVSSKQLERSQRVQIEGDDVLKRFWTIAIADPNELVEYRRTCCRYCYGEGHAYQLTDRELEERETAFKNRKNPKPTEFLDTMGGPGFNPRLAPHPECSNCGGEGLGNQFVKDTRHLSPAAKALYAGVKTTKDGIEVKMHDQQAALVNVGKLLGLYIEKLEHGVKIGLEELLAGAYKKRVGEKPE